MKRLLPIVFGLLLTAFAQQHKISVQKYESPIYPPIARQANISGDVKLKLDVLTSGEVQNVEVLSGHPMLSRAAVENIRLWRFHCDDCRYGEDFRHSIVSSFQLDDGNSGDKRVIFDFPDRVTIYSEPPPWVGIFAISRPKYFWLWKLFHPKFGAFMTTTTICECAQPRASVPQFLPTFCREIAIVPQGLNYLR